MSNPESAEFDAQIRFAVYAHFVERAAAPTRAELSAKLGSSLPDIAASFERLAEGKALVLQPTSREILMAEPFSAVPTPFLVQVGPRSWWANCIWDALGIPAATDDDARSSAYRHASPLVSIEERRGLGR